jgi:protein arginine kinase
MNRDIASLLKNPASFLSAAAGDGICISSRIRLSRNLAQMPFPIAADEACTARISELVSDACRKSAALGGKKCLCFSMGSLDELERQFLLERHLASPELIENRHNSVLAVSKDEHCSVMINEEDHLRIQVLMAGSQLEKCWEKVSALEGELANELAFAWDDQLGYLTECPSNVGTGMRASVMLHLPGLVMTEQIQPTIHGINKLGLAVRGVYGEGSDNTGRLYQVSNQVTLGESEETIMEQLSAVIRQLVEYERRARRMLMEKDRFALLDHVGRAFGLLQNCYKLGETEAAEALSALRLGCDMGLFQHLKKTTVNELFMELGAGHLQMRSGLVLPEAECSVLRAKLCRTKLREKE